MAYSTKYPVSITSVEELRAWVEEELRLISLNAAETEESLGSQGDGIVTPYEFGAKGDGVADDGAALQLALATGKHVDLRNGTFVSTLPLVMQDLQWMYHGKLIKKFTGDLLDMTAQQCALVQVEIDGYSLGFSGRAIIIGGGVSILGRQLLSRVIVGSIDYCLEFTVADCGALFKAYDCAFGRTVSTSEGVKLPTDVSGGFTGREFLFCNQGGSAFIDLGGSRATKIIGGGSTKITWSTANVQYCEILFHRLAGGGIVNGTATTIAHCTIATTLTINGSQHVIGPNTHQGNSLVLSAGTTDCTIAPHDAAFTDASNAASNNKIQGFVASPTPTWTATSGAAPSLGAGTAVGRFRQEGLQVFGSMKFTFGAGASFGTGSYNFNFPAPYNKQPPHDMIVGRAWGQLGAGYVFGNILAFGGANPGFYVESDAGVNWDATNPGTWAVGDFIALDFHYPMD